MIILDVGSGYLEYISPKLTEVTAGRRKWKAQRSARAMSLDETSLHYQMFFTFGEDSIEMLF